MLHRREHSHLSNSRGMTLIEIIIVITILATLGAILGNRVIGARDRANVKQAKIQIADLGKFLDMYNLDCNRYPTTDEGLSALVEAGAPCAQTPYMQMKIPPGGLLDPWGNPYVYTSDGSTYTIISYGADKKEGGSSFAADISSDE